MEQRFTERQVQSKPGRSMEHGAVEASSGKHEQADECIGRCGAVQAAEEL